MISAAKFYESRQKDLGKRFLSSVQDALNRIQATLSYTMKSKTAFVAVSR